MFKIGWFSTGRGEMSKRLFETTIQAIDAGVIPDSKICWVFCNRVQGKSDGTDSFFELVKNSAIPLACRSSREFKPTLRKNNLDKWRCQFDKIILQSIKELEKPDIVVLAGFMLIVSPVLCKALNMINLHPALPRGPKGTWQQVTREIVEQKAKETGSMMHQVTPEVDTEPPITYCRVKITEHTFAEVRAKQKETELPLIVLTLQALASGKLKTGEVVDLTEAIETFLI